MEEARYTAAKTAELNLRHTISTGAGYLTRQQFWHHDSKTAISPYKNSSAGKLKLSRKKKKDNVVRLGLH